MDKVGVVIVVFHPNALELQNKLKHLGADVIIAVVDNILIINVFN